MTQPKPPYVSSVEEEFLRFSQTRLEGLSLTEDEASLKLYRQAIEDGLGQIKARVGGAPCS